METFKKFNGEAARPLQNACVLDADQANVLGLCREARRHGARIMLYCIEPRMLTETVKLLRQNLDSSTSIRQLAEEMIVVGDMPRPCATDTGDDIVVTSAENAFTLAGDAHIPIFLVVAPRGWIGARLKSASRKVDLAKKHMPADVHVALCLLPFRLSTQPAETGDPLVNPNCYVEVALYPRTFSMLNDY